MEKYSAEKVQEIVEEKEAEYKKLEEEYSYLQEEHEDLKQEYADFRIRNNKYVSSLKSILEETIREDKKIKRDCKIIIVLSFILVVLVIALFAL